MSSLSWDNYKIVLSIIHNFLIILNLSVYQEVNQKNLSYTISNIDQYCNLSKNPKRPKYFKVYSRCLLKY